MPWPKSSLHLVPNSSADACAPCLSELPRTYVAALTSVSLLSLPLRGWALWVQASSPITEKTDLVSVNLIVSDFLLTLVSLFTTSDVFLSQYLWTFLLSLVSYGRPLFQCFLCLERFLAVVHPIVFLRYRPLRYRVAVLAPAWATVLVTSSVAVALCDTHRDYLTHFTLVQSTGLLLSFIIISLCSLFILAALLRPPPGDGRRHKGGGGKRRRHRRIQKKAFVMCLLIEVYGATCYLPLVVLIFSGHIWGERRICDVYSYNLWIVLLSSFYFCLHHLHNMGKLTWIGCYTKRREARK